MGKAKSKKFVFKVSLNSEDDLEVTKEVTKFSMDYECFAQNRDAFYSITRAMGGYMKNHHHAKFEDEQKASDFKGFIRNVISEFNYEKNQTES